VSDVESCAPFYSWLEILLNTGDNLINKGRKTRIVREKKAR
jgi:hypothetical protein